MLRTRVGYAGGTTPAPTYHALGDHSEAIQIDFDPSVTSYERLLEEFFASHDACRAPWSRQYRSAIFFHDDAQRRAAETCFEKVAKERLHPVATDLEAFTGFTLAEDYHQKYGLRAEPWLIRELEALYPTTEALLASTAVTRASAFVSGHGSRALVDADLPRMGLSEATAARLRRRALDE